MASKKNDDPVELTPELALAAISRSGYPLETRVERLCKEQGMTFQASPFFPDPFTGKGRELDLLALYQSEKNLPGAHIVSSFLLIECINNGLPLALFRKPTQPNLEPRHAIWLHVAGNPVAIHEPLTIPFQSWANLQSYHPSFAAEFATQYCTFEYQNSKVPEPGKRWVALHSDDHHSTLQKLTDGVEYMKQQIFNWLPMDETVQVNLLHPILVLQGKLWLVDAFNAKGDIVEADHVSLVRTQFRGASLLTWIVDVVTEAALPSFLKALRSSTETLSALVESNRELVMNAAKQQLAARREYIASQSSNMGNHTSQQRRE